MILKAIFITIFLILSFGIYGAGMRGFIDFVSDDENKS